MQKFKKVLLVDDDAIVNEINRAILNNAQFAKEIVATTTVNGALESFVGESEQSDLPDFIFLDINMPVRNGWDFIEDYEKLNFEKNRPLIVMVSSSTDPNDKKRALEKESVVEFISKPISKASLDRLNSFSMS